MDRNRGFSGKSTLSVKQDFYAQIVSTNLTALMVMGGEEIVTKKLNITNQNIRLIFAQALLKMKH